MAKKVGKKPVGKSVASKGQLKPRTKSKPAVAVAAPKAAAKPTAKTAPSPAGKSAKPASAKSSPTKPVSKAATKPAATKAQSKPAGGKAATPVGSKLTSGSVASTVVATVGKVLTKVLPDGTVKKLKKKASRLIAKPELPPVRLPPPPVTSDSKMQKNRAGLSQKELEHFRDLLLEKRRELLGDVTSMEREALRSGNTNLSNLPLHMADTGTDNYEQEFTLGLVEKDRQLLREIQVALAKIQDGSYGVCEGTSKPIAKQRLEVQPWARHSIEYARQMEKPMFRRAY